MATLEQRMGYLEGAYEHLATKEDIERLRGEVKADIADLRGEMKADIAGLRGEMKADIERLQSSLIKWGIGVLIGGMTVATSMAVAVLRLIGS